MSKPVINITHDPSLSYGIIDTKIIETRLPNVNISFKASDGLSTALQINTFKLFKAAQEKLFDNFNVLECCIRGSVVTQLFSQEPIHDFDVHVRIDVSHVHEKQLITTGSSFKWEILKSIQEIANSHTGQVLIKSPEDIVFEERNILGFSSRWSSYNIHTLRVGKHPPVEFTFCAVVKKDGPKERLYDFNVSSLKLLWDSSKEQLSLHTLACDIKSVIEDIFQKKLLCPEPHDVKRKAIPRWLYKVTYAGYHDEDPTLLDKFSDNIKPDQVSTQKGRIAQKVMCEIQKHFSERSIDFTVPLLQLYFTDAASSNLSDIQAESLSSLLHHLKLNQSVTSHTIFSLIESNAKSELAWYLVFLSTQIQQYIHRSKECLQIKIPLEVFKTRQQVRPGSFYLLIPISILWQLKELTCPKFFAHLANEENSFESYSEKATSSLKAMMSHLLSKPNLSPVLLAALKRLKVSPSKFSAQILLKELPRLNLLLEGALPKDIFYQLLNSIDTLDASSLTCDTALIIMKHIQGDIKACDLAAFENSLPNPSISHLAIDILRNFKKDLSDDFDKQKFLEYIIEFQQTSLESIAEFSKCETVRQKKIFDLSFVLLSKGFFPLKNAFYLFDCCIKAHLTRQAELVFRSMITHYQQIDETDLIKSFEIFIETNIADCLDFLLNNKSSIKQNIKNFDPLFQSLIIKIESYKNYREYTEQFLDLLKYFYDKNDSQNLSFFIFSEASSRKAFSLSLFEYLTSNNLFELRQIKDKRSICLEELLFLLQCDTLKNEVVCDSEFENCIIYHCFKYNLNDPLLDLIGFIIEERKECLIEPNIFKVLTLLAKQHDRFIACLKCFLIASEYLKENKIYLDSIVPMLDSLRSFLDKDEQDIGYLTVREEVLPLAKFHRKFALKTIDHPVWKSLWAKLSICETKYLFLKWLDDEDLSVLIEMPQQSKHLQNFAQAFSADHLLLCRIMQAISILDTEKQKSYWDTIFETLSGKSFYPFIEHPQTNDFQQTASIYSLSLAIEYIGELNPDNITTKEVKNLLNLILFAITFGPSYVREGAFNFFCELLNYDKTTFVSMLRSSGIDEEIIFTMADIALRDRDFESLKKVNDTISLRFIDVSENGHSFSTLKFACLFSLQDLVTWRVEYWMRMIRDIFQKDSDSLNAKRDNSELAALNYFSRFLTFIIISISHVLKHNSIASEDYFKMIQKIHFQILLKFIDFLSTKKFIRSSIPLIQMISLVGYLTKQQTQDFVGKFLNYATKQISTLDPVSGLSEDQMVARHLFSQATGYVLHLRNAFKLKKEIDASFITPLMIAARSNLNCFNQEHLVDSELINTLAHLNATMNDKELHIYHRNWLSDIISRSQTVSFDELTLFSLFTFRSTNKFSSSFSSIGIDQGSQKLTFIEKEYFTPTIIKNFVKLFDILFTRFPSHIQPIGDNPREMDLDAFSLLPAYKSSIDWGLVQMKGSSDCEKIKIDFLDVLYKAMHYEGNSLTLAILQASIRYLIQINEKGTVNFQTKAKSRMAKNAAIFYRLVIFLNSLPLILYQDVAIMLHQLIALYESNQALFNKELTKEQNESIVIILRDKLSQQPLDTFPKGFVDKAFISDNGQEEDFLNLDISFKCESVWTEIEPKL